MVKLYNSKCLKCCVMILLVSGGHVIIMITTEADNEIYLKPKVTLHFELPNISLLFLILTKLNIALSCWYPP